MVRQSADKLINSLYNDHVNNVPVSGIANDPFASINHQKILSSGSDKVKQFSQWNISVYPLGYIRPRATKKCCFIINEATVSFKKRFMDDVINPHVNQVKVEEILKGAFTKLVDSLTTHINRMVLCRLVSSFLRRPALFLKVNKISSVSSESLSILSLHSNLILIRLHLSKVIG